MYSESAITLSVDLKEWTRKARSATVTANHTGTGWEELTLDFANANKAFEDGDPDNFTPLPANEVGVYTQLVFIVDGAATSGGGTFYLDDIIKGAGAAPPVAPVFEFNFENDALGDSFDFGSPIQIIDNPASTAINTSTKVLEVLRGPDPFQGAGFSIPNLDLTTPEKIVTIKLYSESAVELSIDLKNGLDGARSAAVMASHTGSGWEELTFDFSSATKAFEEGDPENFTPLPANELGVYTQVVFIVDPNATAGSTMYYLDDIIKF